MPPKAHHNQSSIMSIYIQDWAYLVACSVSLLCQLPTKALMSVWNHAGVYTTGPLTINISGVAALNPAMAGQVQTNPALAGLMYGSINEAAVPIEEGWVKLRGLDPAITKQDICTFFEVILL